MLEFLTDWLQRLLRQPAKLMYIGGSDILPPPLAAQEEQTLLQQAAAGDEAARARLIERNLRLVVYIARRFENTGVNIEDLISIGTIGLIKAVGTFKSDRNIKLATYASRCIENEILMHIRKIAGQKAEVSLDEPINTDWDGNELLLSDVLGTDGDIVMRPMEEDAEQQLLREALARLPERERRIVSLRFGLGGKDAEGGRGPAGHLAVVYLAAGEAHHAAPAARPAAAGLIARRRAARPSARSPAADSARRRCADRRCRIWRNSRTGRHSAPGRPAPSPWRAGPRP